MKDTDNKRNLELIESKDYDTLIKENERVIYYVLKQFKIPLEDQEDLIQECKIRLYIAATMYDVSKGSFSGYAFKSVYNCIKLYFRAKNKNDIIYFNSISLDKNLDTDNGLMDDTIASIIEDKAFNTVSIAKRRYFYQELCNAIESIRSQRRKDIIYSFLFDKSYSMRSLADKYNCSTNSINSTICKAKQDIKNYLLDKGIDSKFFY